LCLVLVTDMFIGLFPDERASLLETRKRFCESLAVQYSAITDSGNLNALKQSMDVLVDRSDDVLSVALVSRNDGVLASTPRHAQLWQGRTDGRSTPTHAQIPIFRGDSEWGTVQVRFTELANSGLLSALDNPLYRLVIIIIAGGFALYFPFMRYALRYLDPSLVIPGRVKAALDQLVEGTVLTDDNLRIVLTNSAFENKVGRSTESLLGADLSALGWRAADDECMPWNRAQKAQTAFTDVRLELDTESQGTRAFTTNVSPITDGQGKQRGLLATFDDVTELEAANRRLQRAVKRLESAQTEVRRQNEELNRLATEDPLTGCLNRRAFFERLESELEIAGREQLDLACIMADVDHFKKINDNYGHAIGDEMIKLIVEVVQEHLRPNDALGRYGGEEFCMLLVGTPDEVALERAEQIRQVFRERSADPRSPVSGNPCTASFGVSSSRHGARDAAALIDEADQALYASKTAGRNRVSMWSKLSDAPEVVAS